MRGQRMADKATDNVEMTRVRTTMRPDEDVEVTPRERDELEAQGLLVAKTEKAGN